MKFRLAAITTAACCTLALTGVTGGLSAAATNREAAGTAGSGSFYTYSGSKPLSSYAPGAILRTRTLSYHVVGISLPITAVQILYRSTNAAGKAIANVTSVLKAPHPAGNEAVSYQSFYDSLNPADSPSRAIAGDVTLGGLISDAESLLVAPSLLQGYSVVVPDTEGPKADFAAGPEYGMNTLNSLRAVTHSSATGLNTKTRIAMMGYSGGAIATDWAAQLAPSYAPAVNKQLVGATEGGVLVDPIHNLTYVSGSSVWAGVAPMAIIGIARAYGINFDSYLSSYGLQLESKLQDASIINALGQYPGLTWAQLVKPQYANPSSIKLLVSTAAKLDMGTAPDPTIPMQIVQGAGGWEEGTNNNQPGIGPGDGVMIAGDVRSLARKFCTSGIKVQYTQSDLTSHVPTALIWVPEALAWIHDRFAGSSAPSSCGSIPAGNPIGS